MELGGGGGRGRDQVTGSGPAEIGNDEERQGAESKAGTGRTQDKEGGITRETRGEGSG